MTGKIAEFLIKQFAPHLNNDEAYIAASLCNMGKVVSAICLPDITDKIRSDIYNTKSSSYVETEKKHDATSHVILGELAGAMWGLPDYVLYTTAYHHTPASDVKSSIDTTGVDFIDFAETEIPKKSENKATLQQVVALSNQLIHIRTGELFRIEEELLYGYASSLNLAKEDIDELGEER